MSLGEEASLTLITILAGVTSALMAILHVYFRKKQCEAAKQVSLTALMEVFQMLNNEMRRKARQIAYKKCTSIIAT